MTGKRSLTARLRALDQAARILTGKRLSDNLRDLAGLVTGRLGESGGGHRPGPDPQDLADCELLGVSPACSERVARLAWRAFAESHHPDRRGGNEDTFKLGQQAFDRVCRRRNWNPH